MSFSPPSGSPHFQFAVFRHREDRPFTYAMLDRRQEELRDSLLASATPAQATFLFAEVAPVITLGYRNTEEDLLLKATSYTELGIELLRVKRGGRATYHGPGQWVVFVVGRLENLTGDPRGVRKFVSLLFQATLETVRERFPLAEIREGAEAGVWSEPGSNGGKVAALGVRIDQGITQHGLCLNVFPTREAFAGIRPCGLDARVAYLESAPGDRESKEALMKRWRERLEEQLLIGLKPINRTPVAR